MFNGGGGDFDLELVVLLLEVNGRYDVIDVESELDLFWRHNDGTAANHPLEPEELSETCSSKHKIIIMVDDLYGLRHLNPCTRVLYTVTLKLTLKKKRSR